MPVYGLKTTHISRVVYFICMTDIYKLFEKRDAAVSARDMVALASTQLNELVGSQTASYATAEGMHTAILAVEDEDDGLTKVVFVKETYALGSSQQTHAFLTYGLVHTVVGWRIHTITPAFLRAMPLHRIAVSRNGGK